MYNSINELFFDTGDRLFLCDNTLWIVPSDNGHNKQEIEIADIQDKGSLHRCD